MAPDTSVYVSAPGPFEDRGVRPDGGRWLVLQPAVNRTSDGVLSSPSSHSQRAPRGGGGDDTSRQDTWQDRWLYFGLKLRWSFFQVSFKGSPTLQCGGPKSRLGVLHSFHTTPSHGTTCRETWEAYGLNSEPLARKAGNSTEMTGYTCEEIVGIQ